MRIVFDDGTLLLEDAPETVPYAEWDDRVDEYRTRAHRYRELLNWAGERDCREGQATLESTTQTVSAVEDAARAYREFNLSPTVTIEPREYQQAALTAWMDHDRRGSVVLPTGSGKTFLGIQAIADAGLSTLVVVPNIDLINPQRTRSLGWGN